MVSISSPIRAQRVGDLDLSIRFKHGNHTIFLFVDPTKPFSNVQDALLSVLKERYPDGLTTSVVPSKKTKLPANASQIKFGLPKVTTDPTLGWRLLSIRSSDTPTSKGFKDNMSVAFAFASDEEDDDITFEVEFPSFEEEEMNDAEE
ncbi:hypothetical protein F5Y16DRAFT_404926 [Xylariaceae sp. FL0255]|nr:hypothetical protein F5Y16DRAFT_404926 [Xylariaceae sp. FL0255]